MKVYIDGKEVDCKNEVKVVMEVETREGIDSNSEIEFTACKDGVIADLVEVTKRSAPSAETTLSFWESWEEFVDQYMVNYKE